MTDSRTVRTAALAACTALATVSLTVSHLSAQRPLTPSG